MNLVFKEPDNKKDIVRKYQAEINRVNSSFWDRRLHCEIRACDGNGRKRESAECNTFFGMRHAKRIVARKIARMHKAYKSHIVTEFLPFEHHMGTVTEPYVAPELAHLLRPIRKPAPRVANEFLSDFTPKE